MTHFLYLAVSSLALFFLHYAADAQVGICYGMLGDNLPPASAVVALFKQHNIKSIRLFDPNQPALEALRGSNIEVILGVPNQDLPSLASSQSAADEWVRRNVINYGDVNFKCIGVGNEVRPSDGGSVLGAMRNIDNAIAAARLPILVSTVIETGLLGNSYPPEDGAFSSEALSYITPIVQFLVERSFPLLVNVYPYFAYINNKEQISLDYALCIGEGIVMPSGVRYQNLFYAVVDATYSALEKVGGSTLKIVVSESGWPSAGGDTTTLEYANTYLNNLIQRVQNGTPKRPGPIDTYIFAMFDENQKIPEYEKSFGIFTPQMQPKYSLTF